MPRQSLKQIFGFNEFRPGQEQTVNALMSGHSAAAIFPTGSGKSLCYQLPALLLPHLTLVVSPLLALMRDQLEFLAKKQIPAAAIDSSQSKEQTQQVMQEAREGRLKILMVSVERFKNERFRRFLQTLRISLLVVDEAHCISEWGHNFRPDYLQLPQYRKQFHINQVLLLTATATQKVIGDMCDKFDISSQYVVMTGFYRPNLYLDIIPATTSDKRSTLLNCLGHSPGQASIVYVTLQQTAEEVAAFLNANGHDALAYHAGMDSDTRQAVQQAFMSGRNTCIVATIAFGMGIDKSDIRLIVHYDLPKSLENYSQEIGRAGRDGQPSRCVVLAGGDRLNTLENFIYSDTPEYGDIVSLLEHIGEQTDVQTGQWETRLLALSTLTNIRQLPLKTLLVYLQMSGILQPLHSYFADYRFKLNLPEPELIALFDAERRAFVTALLDSSAKARTWYSIDFDTLRQSYGSERSRAITALEYFQQKGYIELQSKQMTDVYRMAQTDFDIAATASSLYEHFKQTERSEIARIHRMLRFFESTTCLSQTLAQYFGDNRPQGPCGHCSVCDGRPARLPSAEPLPPLQREDFARWCSPFIEAVSKPVSDELLARFLCGLSMPIFTKIKARRLEGFGRLETYRFEQVLAFVHDNRQL